MYLGKKNARLHLFLRQTLHHRNCRRFLRSILLVCNFCWKEGKNPCSIRLVGQLRFVRRQRKNRRSSLSRPCCWHEWSRGLLQKPSCFSSRQGWKSSTGHRRSDNTCEGWEPLENDLENSRQTLPSPKLFLAHTCFATLRTRYLSWKTWFYQCLVRSWNRSWIRHHRRRSFLFWYICVVAVKKKKKIISLQIVGKNPFCFIYLWIFYFFSMLTVSFFNFIFF